MKTGVKRLKWPILLAGLVVWWGCSGDGSSLGPDGTPIDDVANGGTTNGDTDGDNGTDNGDTIPAVTLTQLSTEIFTPQCALSGCHAGGFPAGNMSLAADRIASETISQASSGNPGEIRVIPGDSANSYLLKKLRGSGIVGSQMPLTGPGLTDEQLALIAQWIDDGAQTD